MKFNKFLNFKNRDSYCLFFNIDKDINIQKYLLLLILVTVISVSNTVNAESLKPRYILEDRNIKSVGILPFVAKDDKLSKLITNKFLFLLSKNISGVKFSLLEKADNTVESILTGDLTDYNSVVKSNTIADAYNYDILEQQVKITIDIEIKDSQENDLIWRRRASKYTTQSWLDFVRSRIGDNNVVDYFLVPNQLATSLKKQYTEDELVDKTVNDVIRDLSDNLVKLK